MPLNPKNPLHIVLDIDNVLAHTKEFMSEPSILFFLRYGAVINIFDPHYIFPGVLEMIRLFYQNDNIRVSFFSSGIKERNHPFVEQLLILALGAAHYSRIKDSVIIRSREDLTANPQGSNHAELQKKSFKGSYGGMKKDLAKTLRPSDNLGATIHIDDDRSYTLFGQEGHLLQSPEAEASHYVRYVAQETRYGQMPDFSESSGDLYIQTNHIFYIVGALKTVIEEAEAKNVSYSDILFAMHFRKIPTSLSDYEFVKKPHAESLSFVHKGLCLLQEINPRLNLFSSELYKTITKAPPSEEEQGALKKYANKNDRFRPR